LPGPVSSTGDKKDNFMQGSIQKQFLKEHTEEIEKLPNRSGKGHHDSIEAFKIAEFLDWPESKVYTSLERIKMIEDKIIDKEAIEQFPTERSVRDFINAGKKTDLRLNKQKSLTLDSVFYKFTL
jgi:hypothetical protein